MAIYQSMQRVRFSSTDDYEKFKIVFADVRHHLKTLPGFLHLTWWTHPQDPTWHNEVSFWTSYEALNDWHMNTYHKHAKEWAVRSGAIMEDIITNFEFKRARLIRVCPTCANIGQAFRFAHRTGSAGRALPKMRLSFPNDARNTRQHGRLQGRARAGGAPLACSIWAPARPKKCSVSKLLL